MSYHMENVLNTCNVNYQKIIKIFSLFSSKATANSTFEGFLYLTTSKLLVKFLNI